ncbi:MULTISPECIES: glycerophosphodiester phosphodiesterase [unclassified Acinetobacter]|jgi:glycerophosphoryl diester phosphodiesterase|uniref:Glycerophosphodiester phosphodiesterase n=1 Tax=Acinetobacter sp. A1-4-2 TaxID=3156489 RepID=A0AAU7SYY6_9GAMM|nr:MULTISPECIES: glycerophosphodiester phosphodiesterase [unclassified Acinetobacter]MDD2946283.1 glycerophosphodiester phosphodiesterase [Acinetobacter sp.]OTG69697.1 glycerophosphodiester phosphodiesterase [Acinetobacter sp. ANC 4218]QQN38850.1 glycerophosphodiester phosphodiesterase [Acinetobacter sp. CS-2]
MRIIGHRGARGEAPENTLGGFQYIHDLGIRAVEFDVRQLKDGELIIMHDDNFLRTTGTNQALYDLNSHQLEAYNQAHIWIDWEKQLTPTLRQTLSIIHDFEHIEVEVKEVATMFDAEKLVLELQQQLHGFEQTAVITSFDLKIHQALKRQYSIFKRGLLVENDIQYLAIEQALELGCCQIGWMNQLASDEMIQATQQAHLGISVWTVNEVERAKHLQSLGIDGLITDFPKMMLEQL